MYLLYFMQHPAEQPTATWDGVFFFLVLTELTFLQCVYIEEVPKLSP